MLPTVVPFATPSIPLTIRPDGDSTPMPDPIAFTPMPIRCMSASDLFYAFERAVVDASGAVSPSEFFDHATGAWSATFDPAAHVKPMTRVAPAGSPNSQFQGFGVPYPVAVARGATVLFYTKDAAGTLVEWGLRDGRSAASESGAW